MYIDIFFTANKNNRIMTGIPTSVNNMFIEKISGSGLIGKE